MGRSWRWPPRSHSRGGAGRCVGHRLLPSSLATAAIVVNLLTRTGAPLCRPGSVFRGHGAWHILTAIAIALCVAPPSGSGRVDASPHELSPHTTAGFPARTIAAVSYDEGIPGAAFESWFAARQT